MAAQQVAKHTGPEDVVLGPAQVEQLAAVVAELGRAAVARHVGTAGCALDVYLQKWCVLVMASLGDGVRPLCPTSTLLSG